MTDSPSWGAGGPGEGSGQGGNPGGNLGEGQPRQPWFPPAGQPGQPPPGAGYGQPPGGQSPPPPGWSPLPQAPKPGVIPLRPIAVGEILDGAFTSIRRNPKATTGIAAIVLTISGVLTTVVTLLLVSQPLLNTASGQPPSGAQVISFLAVLVPRLLATFVLAFVVQILLAGLLTAVIGRSVLGERITAGQAWHIALPRLGALVGATLLTGGAVVGPFLATALIVTLLAVAGAPVWLPIVLGVLGVLASVVFGVWFWVMFAMSAPAVVLERQGPAEALRRSWRLVRGSFWRVFGILLLASLVVIVAASILRLPFTAISAILFGSSATFTQALHPGVLSVIIGAVGTIIAGAITQPISAGVTVLLYVDLRMRREGLDLILQSATSGGQVPGDELATVWRPAGPGGPETAGAPGAPGAPAAPGGPGGAAPPGGPAGPVQAGPPAPDAPPAW